ncbi:hypothetical protein M3Y97_00166500 [Aphelenchoides bicaudatus]|nr:hypothetical protein M3Y97_00166500 [Aphelenchoides bicaudatus]
MWSKKTPTINPILICPLIALLIVFLMLIFIFQMSQLFFINHYHDARLYNNDHQYWTRRRTAFGQRTHRTNDEQEQLELARDRQILAELLFKLNPKRKLDQQLDHLPFKHSQRLVRRAENFHNDETLLKKQPEQLKRQPAFGQTKMPIISVDKEIPHEPIVYDDVIDDFPASSNLLNFEAEGSGMNKYQVDASVISQEESDYDGSDFNNMIPPLSRSFFALKLK